MLSAVKKMASGLRKSGLETGDCVMLMASNHIELAISILAVLKAGGACICLTLNLFAGN